MQGTFRGFLLKSTQVTVTVQMTDSADHYVGKAGLAAGITKYLTKVGGTPTAATMTTAELDASNSKGLYSLIFTTSHTDTLGEFALNLTAAGADQSIYWWSVVDYLPGENVLVQNGTGSGQIAITSGQLQVQSGTGSGQISLSSGLVTLAGVTHTGAVIPTVTTLTDLTTTANSEPASAPASTAALSAKLGWLFALAKNKLTQSATTSTLFANDSVTSVATSTVSDDSTTFTRGKWS